MEAPALSAINRPRRSTITTRPRAACPAVRASSPSARTRFLRSGSAAVAAITSAWLVDWERTSASTRRPSWSASGTSSETIASTRT